MNYPTNSATRSPPDFRPGAFDEWEYEYDEHETEDIYFTLDLTTHVPNALVTKPLSDGPNPSSDAEDEQRSTIQITDLHTDRPLVRLDDGFYSCTWTTDLGTQFHISEAGVTEKPYRPGTVLDVVGTSQTRLLGKPVELRSRHTSDTRDVPDRNTGGVTNEDQESESDVEGDNPPEQPSPGLQTAPGQQLQIPRDLCKHPAGEVQASFLERLSEIKLKKGEKDIVPIYSVRSYEPPPNVNELREQGLAADAEQTRLTKDAQRAATSQRPQKRRRKMTYAEKGITTSEAGPAGRHSRQVTKARLGLHSELPASASQPKHSPENLDPS